MKNETNGTSSDDTGRCERCQRAICSSQLKRVVMESGAEETLCEDCRAGSWEIIEREAEPETEQ